MFHFLHLNNFMGFKYWVSNRHIQNFAYDMPSVRKIQRLKQPWGLFSRCLKKVLILPKFISWVNWGEALRFESTCMPEVGKNPAILGLIVALATRCAIGASYK